MKVSTLVRWTS